MDILAAIGKNFRRIRGGFGRAFLIPFKYPIFYGTSRGSPQRSFVASVLRDVYCPACGGRHTLCYPDEDVVYSNRDYEYDCPTTKLVVRLATGAWSEPDEDCPKGAVILRLVKT